MVILCLARDLPGALQLDNGAHDRVPGAPNGLAFRTIFRASCPSVMRGAPFHADYSQSDLQRGGQFRWQEIETWKARFGVDEWVRRLKDTKVCPGMPLLVEPGKAVG